MVHQEILLRMNEMQVSIDYTTVISTSLSKIKHISDIKCIETTNIKSFRDLSGLYFTSNKRNTMTKK